LLFFALLKENSGLEQSQFSYLLHVHC